MFCVHCGEKIEENARFCTKCGKRAGAITQDGRGVDESFKTASVGKRLVNFILDRIISVILIVLVIALVFAINPQLEENGSLLLGIMVILFFPIYDIFFEGVWGKTPAKVLTKTKVVAHDGLKPSFKKVLGRTLARFVPFEPFSFLGGSFPIGWHDKWSGTLVVPAHYSVDDIKSINFTAVKKSTASTFVIVVVAIITGIALVGILASIVLAALNTAREKAKDAATKSNTINAQNDWQHTLNNLNTKSSEEWKTFSSAIGGFSILMPGDPVYETEKNITVPDTDLTYRMDAYSSTTGDITYMIAKFIYSSELGEFDTDRFLEGSLNGLLENDVTNELESSTYTYYSGYRALDFLIRHGTGGYMKGRIILIGQDLYLLAVDGGSRFVTYDRFFLSFKLN